MTRTLAVDCGGTGIKASVLDEDGGLVVEPVRVPTPYPLPPRRLVEVIGGLAGQLPPAARATVGMPGMIRHGVVITTPHYVTRRGPRSARDAALVAEWGHRDIRADFEEGLGMPTLVLNDAEVHGAGCVSGQGLEVMLTLGTGLGAAVFDDGEVAPHLELSHAPIRTGVIIDHYIGDAERRRLGPAAWSRRVLGVVRELRPVLAWDRLYLGGGNAQRLTDAALGHLGTEVRIVPNEAGITGGARAWKLRRSR